MRIKATAIFIPPFAPRKNAERGNDLPLSVVIKQYFTGYYRYSGLLLAQYRLR